MVFGSKRQYTGNVRSCLRFERSSVFPQYLFKRAHKSLVLRSWGSSYSFLCMSDYKQWIRCWFGPCSFVLGRWYTLTFDRLSISIKRCWSQFASSCGERKRRTCCDGIHTWNVRMCKSCTQPNSCTSWYKYHLHLWWFCRHWYSFLFSLNIVHAIEMRSFSLLNRISWTWWWDWGPRSSLSLQISLEICIRCKDQTITLFIVSFKVSFLRQWLSVVFIWSVLSVHLLITVIIIRNVCVVNNVVYGIGSLIQNVVMMEFNCHLPMNVLVVCFFVCLFSHWQQCHSRSDFGKASTKEKASSYSICFLHLTGTDDKLVCPPGTHKVDQVNQFYFFLFFYRVLLFRLLCWKDTDGNVFLFW